MSPTDLPVRAPVIDPAYGLSAFGALLGAGAGTGLGLLLGTSYSSRFMPDAELEGIVPVVIGSLAGLWLGAIAGAWMLLALSHKVGPRPTALLLAGALPAWGIVSLPSFFWLSQQLAGDKGLPNFLAIALPVLILAVPPALVSRALVVHRERLQAKREEISL